MVVLHIAAIKNDYTSGVDVAVRQHIKAQSKLEQVAVVNINNTMVDDCAQQFEYRAEFKLEDFPAPFCSPDMVVFHNTYYFDFVKISKEIRKKNIPYIIIPHGALSVTAQRKKWLKKKAANFLFFNRFFKGACAIQFLSRREMQDSKYKNKGFVGTNGVECPILQYKVKQRDEIKMLYIGRTEVHIKGIDMMIEAVSRCRDLFDAHKVHLDLYGPDCEGGYETIRMLISKHQVAEYVSLHHAVLGDEKIKILLDSDFFIQTSRTEGMPMGVLETLSYGVPCIVTEGTRMGDVIREYDAGWVASNDVAAISDALRQAIEEKSLWEQKSVQARRLVLENYVWDKVAVQTMSEYKKIIVRM